MKQIEDTIGSMSEQEKFDKQRNYDYEEAHYHHVLMDVVELIYNYGWEPVLKDIIALKENKEW